MEDQPEDDDAMREARAELRIVMDECGYDIYGGGGEVEPWNYAWMEGFIEGCKKKTTP